MTRVAEDLAGLDRQVRKTDVQAAYDRCLRSGDAARFESLYSEQERLGVTAYPGDVFAIVTVPETPPTDEWPADWRAHPPFQEAQTVAGMPRRQRRAYVPVHFQHVRAEEKRPDGCIGYYVPLIVPVERRAAAGLGGIGRYHWIF